MGSVSSSHSSERDMADMTDNATTTRQLRGTSVSTACYSTVACLWLYSSMSTLR